ncbi:phage fiber-tail adaptor protein [Gluconobacter albidus]|uniref:phage fiber-tail adaptor protein n=1 Tax=Gluconobacter albidus TaxID=318683 RepID=UPI0030A0C37F
MTTVHNLTPSPLRTVMLQSCTGLFAQVMWTPKASADCLDYALDFSTLLAGTGDTLTAIRSAVVTTATGSAYDLKVMWSAVAGPLVVAFLASGQPNTAQKILFEITTQQGRVYSVMAVLQITALTAATAPPSDFPADTLTNGKVLIAGIEALPSGYSANGRVVMATEDAAPVGTPSFESVTAATYAGDGSGLDVTSDGKAQTISEWIAALSSGGAQGVGIKAINLTQDPVVAGQPSTVTLTATLTDGTRTAPATFEVPTGVPGADADPSKFLALAPDKAADLQTIIAPADSGFDATYALQLSNGADTLQVGCLNSYGTRWLGIKSTNGTAGIRLKDQYNNAATISGHTSKDSSTEIYSSWLGVDCAYGNGGLRIINKDSQNFCWQIWANSTSSGQVPLRISAGNADGSAWQDPLVSFDAKTNTAEFLNEPVVKTAYTFASLPASPVAWQRAVVTDKTIGSGVQGVVAMWNPNTKAWTGLGGETLV